MKSSMKKSIYEEENIKYKNTIDEEYNEMSYNDALKSDKRKFYQYYWSLIKKKHLIISTFFSPNDYNLLSIKVCLFLISIALFICINAMFFDDQIIHFVHIYKGKYKLIYQIPITIYSTLISIPISLSLKKLALTQNNIMDLKNKKKFEEMLEYSVKIKKCIQIKTIIFFIFAAILFIFFWYYITAFSAVFKNVQRQLIKDSIITFIESMLYPFILNLIPALLRKYALSLKNKCLFKTSKIFAIV